MKWLKQIYFILTLICLLSVSGSSQNFSNKGTEFWLAYPAHIDGNTSRMALYISSDISTTGTVFLAGRSIPFTVTANRASVVQISPATYPVINSQNEGIATGNGIRIVSAAPVVVYAHVLNAARSGSTLLFPTNTLGREYIVAAYNSVADNPPPPNAVNASPSGSQFTIVAVEDNTTVEITPSATDVQNSRPAGVPFVIQLNKGDVYQFRTNYQNDVTGTKIRSLASPNSPCKPLAVFSGNAWSAFGCPGIIGTNCQASGGDNLFQQMIPRAAWGKEYITAPFADRPFDIYRIIVDDPTTQVTVNGSLLPSTLLVNNTYYQLAGSVPNVITSTKPVIVVQYMISQNCDPRNNTAPNCGVLPGAPGYPGPASFPGDPEMIIINPIEQTINDVTVVSARADLTPPNTNITKHFFTIIMKTVATSSLRIDGARPTGTFIPIGTSGYSYLHENVTTSTQSNPSHRINADSGFVALAYGMGSVESYGYNAGTNVIDLYQFITTRNQYATVNSPVACKNAPFIISLTIPYVPKDMKWEIPNYPDVSITDPIPDSVYQVNGRTIYEFRLPTPYVYTQIGTYPIKVTANNPTPDGCSGIQLINFDLQVFDPPVVDFTWPAVPASGCTDSTITFTTNNNTGGRPIIRHFWDFGDGTFAYVNNPSKVYNNPGEYTIRYAVLTDVGCLSDTVKKVIRVTNTPVANFSISNPLCRGGNVTFGNLSTLAGNFGTIEKWNWNLDNSNIITNTDGRSVSSVYSNATTYNVSLQVESSTGCRSVTNQKSISVQPLPEPGFILPEICLDDAIAVFTDTTKIANGSSGFSYQWNFNAGNPPVNPGPSILTSTAQNPQVRYNQFGNYEVTLKVTSSAGCIDSVRRSFTVNGSVPDAAFLILQTNNNCSNREVEIQNKSSVDFGSVTKVEIYWDNVGSPTIVEVDDTPSPNKIYRHKYPEFQTPFTKNYVIRFRAFSGGVCVDEQIQTIIVNASPLIRFTPISDICLNDAPRLITQAVETAGLAGIGVYSGKGIDAFGLLTPEQAGVGVHTIKYKFISSAGCIDSATQTIRVWDYPRISAGPDLFVLEEGQRIIDGATATGQLLQYNWTPPTYLSSVSVLRPTIQQPKTDQIYTLTVTGEGGCTATDEVLMKVLAAPKAPNTFTPNGDGINDLWEIQNLKDYPGCIVEIYNTAGSLVFRSVGYATPWDGTWKGQKVPVGTYYYVIDPKNGRPRTAGYVTVLR